jgi:2-polyprenyl-6-methoxyphenol hydroxylase-like FAD-dependent oxidoreductase
MSPEQVENSFSADEKAERENLVNKGLELENVEIIRINHLETFLAAIVEELAQNDKEHLHIYYGATLKASKTDDHINLEFELRSKDKKSSHAVHSDILVIAEGAGARLASQLDLKQDTLSKTLYGSTMAMRLPVGFDLALRPIENKEGTASVKGIAIIDDKKLTKPGHDLEGNRGRKYRWTMIKEQELCRELNKILEKTAKATNSPSDSLLLPCETISANLEEKWRKTNGGKEFYLPRTRYFFTGGIAYLGAELSKEHFEIFQKKEAAAKNGLKEFLLVLAKKHMPRQYIEAQKFANKTEVIAAEALKSDFNEANRARVVIATEENYSLTSFPIELKKADSFYKKFKNLAVLRVGDSYATTHFFTGSGAVNGLRAAIYVGEALQNGAREEDFMKASQKISAATDEMHEKVTKGTGNAPLDGPFNERL